MVYTIKSDIDKDTPMKTQETAEMNVWTSGGIFLLKRDESRADMNWIWINTERQVVNNNLKFFQYNYLKLSTV